jgi:threonine dehydrogenase-like Zn-dependent dehydrogenase
MSRLMRLVESGRIDLRPLLTHRFRFDRIADAYRLFGEQGDNVLKVSIEMT